MPLELCGAAQRELAATHYGCVEKMIYGRIPLMHTANCINKTMNKCRINEHIGNEERWAKITDRTKRELPIFTDCIHCQNTIYNAIPITITKELKDYPNNFVFRIDFTDESGEQINHVLDYYILGTGSVDWEYTKAFEKHSTE